jgi:hypothetical protein
VQKKKTILGWSVAACLTFALSGCLKTSEPTKTPAKAYISILHLATAPPSTSLEIYFNSSKVSDPFAAGTVSPIYSAVDKGFFAINFKKAGADSLFAALPADQYDSLGFYSIMLYNQPGGGANAIMVQDDFSDLTLDKVFVRFFHASTGINNLGPVDFYIDNTKTSTNRSLADNQFGAYLNQFQPANTGTHSFSVKLSSNDSLITTVNDITLLSGNAYTVYLKGNPGGTSPNNLGLGVLRAANQ